MVSAPPLAALPWLHHEFGTRHSAPLTGRVATLRQIHSAAVWSVRRSPSGLDEGVCLGEGDALITSEPGLLLAIRTADCVPILLADPVRRVVAAVHAGWRGTVAGILTQTVCQMHTDYETNPMDLVAAIGPAIGPCCFAVGSDVPLPVVAGKADLWEANRQQLEQAGVVTIWTAGQCTMCQPAFFYSFRRAKETGRMVSSIGLRE
jgi:YfiH family protein